MIKAFICSILILLMIQAAFCGDKLFTGSRSTNWDNPNNWYPPGIPGPGDHVVIPFSAPLCNIPGKNITAASLTNSGNVRCAGTQITTEAFVNTGSIYSDSKLIIVAPKGETLSFDNNGTIEAPNGILAIGVNNQFTGIVENDGTISGKEVFINAQALVNGMSTGDITGDIINIQLNGEFFNHVWGRILGNNYDDYNGGSIFIMVGDNFNNYGTIAGGWSRYAKGGSVEIFVGNQLTNWSAASIKSGDGSRDGHVLINSRVFEDEGILRGGYFPERSKALVDTASLGNVTIIADSMKIEHPDSVLAADTLRFVSRSIIINDLIERPHIFGENGIYFYNLPGGFVDFSGIFAEFPIICQYDYIYIFSNNIIPPGAGLGSIMIPGPLTFAADTGVVIGSVTWGYYTGLAGERDSFLVEMQNLTPSPRALFYGITSKRGWVTPIAGSTAPKPFQSGQNVWVRYTVPEGTPLNVIDTVVTVLGINPDFAETVFSYLSVFLTPDDREALTYEIFAGWQMLSFPFVDTLRLPDCYPTAFLPAWSFIPVISAYDWIVMSEPGTGFWLLFERDTTISFSGFNRLDTLSITLFPGWNMLGGTADNLPVAMLTDYPEVFESVIGWDAEARSYFIADFLTPGFCYWVFVEDTVEVRLPR
ncbi:hypothetical protein JXI42_04680 [bacterium]|nr:hypothetical protein [bacterium]